MSPSVNYTVGEIPEITYVLDAFTHVNYRWVGRRVGEIKCLVI